jgi:hypothetical protein
MNAQIEWGSDSENFDKRIIEFGVVVEKLWMFEVSVAFLQISWEKIKKMDFLELFLDEKIHGLSPRGCGPRRPGPPWTGGHCRMPELIGARPPVALVAGVAG